MNNRGFTLVEIAIVVMAIGLIISGVVGGQALIKQARLRGIVSEVEKQNVAMTSFKEAYGLLPGDLNTAASYWTECTDSGANLCNGNGDGRIGGNAGTDYENNRVWQHLALSDLLKGAYDGDDTIAIGLSVPASNWNSAGYHITYRITPISGKVGHFTTFAGLDFGSNQLDVAVISPKDAQSLDEKMDDGTAEGGVMIGADGGDDYTGCLNGSNNYDITIADTECILHFVYK